MDLMRTLSHNGDSASLKSGKAVGDSVFSMGIDDSAVDYSNSGDGRSHSNTMSGILVSSIY